MMIHTKSLLLAATLLISSGIYAYALSAVTVSSRMQGIISQARSAHNSGLLNHGPSNIAQGTVSRLSANLGSNRFDSTFGLGGHFPNPISTKATQGATIRPITGIPTTHGSITPVTVAQPNSANTGIQFQHGFLIGNMSRTTQSFVSATANSSDSHAESTNTASNSSDSHAEGNKTTTNIVVSSSSSTKSLVGGAEKGFSKGCTGGSCSGSGTCSGNSHAGCTGSIGNLVAIRSSGDTLDLFGGGGARGARTAERSTTASGYSTHSVGTNTTTSVVVSGSGTGSLVGGAEKGLYSCGGCSGDLRNLSVVQISNQRRIDESNSGKVNKSNEPSLKLERHTVTKYPIENIAAASRIGKPLEATVGQGSLLVMNKDPVTVHTTYGDLQIAPRAGVYVVQIGHEVGIFNLVDGHDGDVSLNVDSTSYSIPLGHALILSSENKPLDDFVLTKGIPMNNSKSIVNGSGTSIYSGEFSYFDALNSSPQLSEFLNSKNPDEIDAGNKLLKMLAIVRAEGQ